jgi:hypothetical protein
MLAIRKDHRVPQVGTKRGDTFQIVLIQVKGGAAAKPTSEDAQRLRIVARYHRAGRVLLATWKKGSEARFYSLRQKAISGEGDWVEVSDLKQIFE